MTERSEPGHCFRWHATFVAMVLLLAGTCRAMAAASFRTGTSERDLDRAFAETVHPFLETYCFACHGEEKQKGKLDLRPYANRAAVAKDYRRWESVLEKLKAEEMPPEEARHHPTAELRRQVIDWIQA